MTLAELMLGFRKKNNLTQSEMAKRCGLSRGTIARFESPNNQKRPSTRTVWQLFDIMGLSDDVLMNLFTDDEIFSDCEFDPDWKMLMELIHEDSLGNEEGMEQIEEGSIEWYAMMQPLEEPDCENFDLIDLTNVKPAKKRNKKRKKRKNKI